MTITPEQVNDIIADVKDTAHSMLKDHDNYGEDVDTTRGVWSTVAWNEHGPMVTVLLTLEMPSQREVDHLVVVGFAIPHDGQLTVAVNHMDGLAINDNAEEMFPG